MYTFPSQKGKEEPMIETMRRILSLNEGKDLDMLIHEGLLPKHTYQELKTILEDMLEREQTLKEKSEPPDNIDKELEETLMAWAFTYREPYIGMHEQAVITKFSQHMMDLFNADKEAYLASEAEKKRLQSLLAQNLATIYEGSGKGGETEADSEPEGGLITKEVKDLKIRPSLSFHEYPHESLSRLSSEAESQYLESTSNYGIPGGVTDSFGMFPMSEEGEDKEAEEKEAFIDKLEQEIRDALTHYTKEADEEGAEEEGAEWGLGQDVWDWGEQIPPPGYGQHEEFEQGYEFEEYVGKDLDLFQNLPGYPLKPHGHPSSVHDHSEFTVCCVTVRKYAEWIYAQSVFLVKWNKMYSKCIKVLREFEDRKRRMNFLKGQKQQFSMFENSLRKMMKLLRQYREYTDSLGEGIFESFKGKKVICCRKCLDENRVPEMDDDPAHKQMNLLILNIKAMQDWEALLEEMVDPDDILRDIGKTVTFEQAAKPSKQPPKAKDKGKKKQPEITTIYEIVELNAGSDDTLYIDIEEL